MNDYYVYIYLREDGTPYYVGKGRGKRAFSTKRRFIKPKDETKIIFHSKNLTEEEAFIIEKELIAQYGRKNNGTGILRNLTDGGEGQSGAIYSDEIRAKRSIIMKEVMSRPEVRAKVSATLKELLNRPEVKAKHSAMMKEVMNRPEVKAKVSAASKKAMNRPEVKAKIKEALNRPETKAKKSSTLKEVMNRPETKAKVVAAAKKRFITPEARARHSEIMKIAMKEYYRKKREAKQASAGTLTPFLEDQL